MLKPLLVALLLSVPALVACTQNTQTQQSDAGSLTVSSTESDCTLSAVEAPSGTLTFKVTNDGSEATEFYLLGEDDRIAGEVENIGPGLTRQLVVSAAAGSYVTVCKPGMQGEGIRAAFTVTPSAE